MDQPTQPSGPSPSSGPSFEPSPSSAPSSEQSFPRQQARTRRFSLGAPRTVTISPDGSRVVFVRSRGGADPAGCLWSFDVASGSEQLLLDPVAALGGADEDLPAEEKARRERAREVAGGVVSYVTDDDARLALVPLSGRLFLVPLDGSSPARDLDVDAPVLDPRVSPDGRLVAYVSGGALRVAGLDGTAPRVLLTPESDDVVYGLAEFVAAEEMDRMRGHWWSPGSDRLLVARVDESPVQRWYIADPANPASPPNEVRYPAAGTADADVSLSITSLSGERVAVEWDREALPYLVRASWTTGGLVLQVFSRDQQRAVTLSVDPDSGMTTTLREDSDQSWVDAVPGVPTALPDGRLLHVVAEAGADVHALAVDGVVVTPGALDVSAVLRADDDGVLLMAADDPMQTHLYELAPGGELVRLSGGEGVRVDGVHVGSSRGGTTVLTSATLGEPRARTTVRRGDVVLELRSFAETPAVTPAPVLLLAGRRHLRTALLLPTGWEPEHGPLPVLMDPYGGPHGRRVAHASGLFRESQWWADQGFAVVVADGRGTPGRGLTWDREVRLDLATAPLEDQVDALHAVAELHPELDLTRVAIRGWSFGGYLAALAVLRRPDVFHAAVAGAPVTDWRLYDTFYTERYLGHPDEHPEAYELSSLTGMVAGLTRPLMLVHGLADDNVVSAHTLRLSSALLAAGKPHEVLPLSGVTHMTPQEEVAENLLLLQLDFLRRALHLG